MADNTLKLCEGPALPGMALPKAMEGIEKHLESVAVMCRISSRVDAAQIAGVLAVCGEQQRLLKLAFIENGMLANKIEILTRHQLDMFKKYERRLSATEKRLSACELENKVTKRYLKQTRKKLSSFQALQKAKSDSQWWAVKVSCSDYDSLTSLSRYSGMPDLEFMLRLNQLMIDFVKDPEMTELLLPPMGNDERAELSKLASIYKLRCRYNKSTQLASSTLIKARQTCIPARGEVDNVLTPYTQRKMKDAQEENATQAPSSPTNTTSADMNNQIPTQQQSQPEQAEGAAQPPSSSSSLAEATSALPSYMLTPVSSLGTPTITLEMDPQTSMQTNQTRPESRAQEQSSESPLPHQLDLAARLASTMKVNRLDKTNPSTLFQVLSNSSSSLAQNNPQLLFSNTLPYSTLLAQGNAQTNSLHLALLAQQQLKSANIAAQHSPSGISTVLASPLPPGLSSVQQQSQSPSSLSLTPTPPNVPVTPPTVTPTMPTVTPTQPPVTSILPVVTPTPPTVTPTRSSQPLGPSVTKRDHLTTSAKRSHPATSAGSPLLSKRPHMSRRST